MSRIVNVEPNWPRLLDWMNEALRTGSISTDRVAEFTRERDKVAKYVEFLKQKGGEAK